MADEILDDRVQLTLRLPRDLHAKLIEATAGMGRSLNAEIVARLAQSLEPIDPALTMEVVKALEAAVVDLKTTLGQARKRLRADDPGDEH